MGSAGSTFPSASADSTRVPTRRPAAESASSSRSDARELRIDSLWSPALGVRKRVAVWLPPSYHRDPARRFPTLYYLHGMWGSERDWAEHGRIAQVADSLVALGVPEAIIVMPDGDNGYYTNWATSGDAEGCRRAPPIPEAPDTYCVQRPRYEDYMRRDVVRWVDSTLRTIPDAAHRGIAGLSMGGYGAVTLALRHPDIWGAAASHSGVLSLLQARDSSGRARMTPDIAELERVWGPRFWPLIVPVFGRDTSGWWAREPSRLATQRVEAGGPTPALFIDVGTSDALVLGGNRIFRDELRRLGITAEYREWPGGHTWTYWRAHVPESLRWLSERIARD